MTPSEAYEGEMSGTCRLYIMRCRECGGGKIGWSRDPLLRRQGLTLRHVRRHHDEPTKLFDRLEALNIVKQKVIPYGWRYEGERMLWEKAVDLEGKPRLYTTRQNGTPLSPELIKDRAGKSPPEWFAPGFPANQLAKWLADLDPHQPDLL